MYDSFSKKKLFILFQSTTFLRRFFTIGFTVFYIEIRRQMLPFFDDYDQY